MRFSTLAVHKHLHRIRLSVACIAAALAISSIGIVQPAIAQEATAAPVTGSQGQIAFSTTRDGNMEIYVMDADGSNPQRLTNNPAGDFVNNWSPDGQQILFNSVRDGNSELYVMNADGSNVR